MATSTKNTTQLTEPYQPFIFHNGEKAFTPKELIKICERMQQDSIYFLLREDFEKWLNYIERRDLAQIATEARLAADTDEKRLSNFIQNCYRIFEQEAVTKEVASKEISSTEKKKQEKSFSFPGANLWQKFFGGKN